MMVVLTALLMIGVVGVVAAPGASAACTLSGAGTDLSPYLIGTANDMQQLGMETVDGCGLDKVYKLTADIDMSTYGEWNGAGAYAAAVTATRFTGTFDGDNKTIRHITAKATPGPYYGLFRATGALAVIKNLTVHNFKIGGSATPTAASPDNQGTIIGAHTATSDAAGYVTLDNVHVTNGSVIGDNLIGGLIGHVDRGGMKFTNVSYRGTVHGNTISGGLVGSGNGSADAAAPTAIDTALFKGSVTTNGNSASVGGAMGGCGHCRALTNIRTRGSVTALGATYATGGIVGNLQPMVTDYSFLDAKVAITKPNGITGGLFGIVDFGYGGTPIISDSVFHGSITQANSSNHTVGGLIGWLSNGQGTAASFKIDSSYAYGPVEIPDAATAIVGGLVGEHRQLLATGGGTTFTNSHSRMWLFGLSDTRPQPAPATSTNATGGLVGLLSADETLTYVKSAYHANAKLTSALGFAEGTAPSNSGVTAVVSGNEATFFDSTATWSNPAPVTTWQSYNSLTPTTRWLRSSGVIAGFPLLLWETTYVPAGASPQITPTVSSASPTTLQTVTVSYTSTPAFTPTFDDVAVTCKLDTEPAFACSSPYTFSAGTVGLHTLVMTPISTPFTGGGAVKSVSWTTAAPIPDAPAKPTVTAADGEAVVTVAAGSGATPTSYTVTSSPESKTCTVTGAAGSCPVTGLTNGVPYTFTATATNGSGTSGSSVASDPATPLLTPAVPQQPTVATLNASASVTVAPGAGGGVATKYVVTAYASSTPSGTCEILAGASPLSCLVTPLTNGTVYTFKATAVNANTTASAASVASALITPVAAPSVPQAPTAVTLDASARVTVVPGASGGAVVEYTVTAYAGSTASGTCPVLATASPLSCVVAGLTNGTAYTFKASATNATTTSAEGPASNSVTPIAAPTVPGQPLVQTRDASASVTVAPGPGGGAAASYTVTSSPESKTCSVSNPSSSLTCTVVGLTNGTAYTFTATATNPNSTSVASLASASITPVALPSTPAAPTVTVGDARATITVVLGSGGAEASWLVTAVENGSTCTITAPETSCVVTGLVNALAYTFTAVATNATGSSVSSPASTSATPMITPPGAPGRPSAIAGDGLATVSVTAGSGGAASTYTVTATPGGATCTVTASATSCVVRGLTNGTAYTFTATATNDSGTSPSSSASGAVTPRAPAIAAIPPGAPNVPGAAALTGGAALPPVPGAARCKSAMCKTKGIVPTGATKIMQTATSSTKKINGRCTMKAPKKGPKAYACKVRLKKGTWTITTQAMQGGVVIAQTVETMRVR
jgi:hypothetical protein